MERRGLAKEKRVWRRMLGWKAWLLIASLWLCPGLAMAGSLTLSWNANTESDLAGYKVYYGAASKAYGTPIDTGKVTTYVVTGLEEKKTYYFAVIAYDQAGNESSLSPEVFGLVPDKTPPAPPNGLTVK